MFGNCGIRECGKGNLFNNYRNNDIFGWNEVVDICNGRRGPHSPTNAIQRQTSLLETLAWFSRWKELHDKRVKDKHATKYIFFANETWFCIKLLLLGHVAVMHIYCVIKGKSISPWTMNTDMLERFFGDA